MAFVIKKEPVFEYDGTFTRSVWLDPSEMRGLTGDEFNQLIWTMIKEHNAYPHTELASDEYTFRIEGGHGDSYMDIYIDYEYRYTQDLIERQRVLFEKRMQEYREWREENKDAIEKEQECRKKKRKHEAKIKELEAQIAELKRRQDME